MTQTQSPTEQQMAVLTGMARGYGFTDPRRAPVLKSPGEYGMAFEDMFFPSLDGVTLEAWFIPADSDRLIICNHPLTMNRYGFPGHLEPWSSFAPVEVEFNKVYRALHDAGYNVLTYDLRNHGLSGAANGGVVGTGLLEWRDVVGAQLFVQTHEKLKHMSVGLFNPCAGGNAAMVAMSKRPELFQDVRAFVCPQPCSCAIAADEICKLQGAGGLMDELETEMRKAGAFLNADMSPHPYAANVTVPTFIIQVREDLWSRQEDVQTTFDLIGTTDKKLFWIDGTTARFDGYNYFGEHPEQMIEFFDQRMK